MECTRHLHWRGRARISSITFTKSVICFSNKLIFTRTDSSCTRNTHTHTLSLISPCKSKQSSHYLLKIPLMTDGCLVRGWCGAPLYCGNLYQCVINDCIYLCVIKSPKGGKPFKITTWPLTSSPQLVTFTYLICKTHFVNAHFTHLGVSWHIIAHALSSTPRDMAASSLTCCCFHQLINGHLRRNLLIETRGSCEESLLPPGLERGVTALSPVASPWTERM